jgi:hypothetical protein
LVVGIGNRVGGARAVWIRVSASVARCIEDFFFSPLHSPIFYIKKKVGGSTPNIYGCIKYHTVHIILVLRLQAP